MKVLEVYQQKLRYKNYSKRTIETYTCYLSKFLKENNIIDPYQVTLSQLKKYLESKNYSSIAQQNQVIGALKLFAKYLLNKSELHLSKIERPKKHKKLPKVIDLNALKDKIDTIENIKHKTILSVGFAAGLRVSEVINLKLSDIDRDRMMLHIKNSKGRKDRLVPFSKQLLSLLEKYYRTYKPKEYLFNGQSTAQYTASSCNKLMKRYIGENTSFHLLRHSAATAIHESGTDIATLAKFLGHNSVKTTMIYTHISNNALQRIELPI